MGETGTELLGGKGNNRVFEEKAKGLEVAEASLSVKSKTLTGGGVVKLGVGKYSVILGLDQGTTSGEKGVTRIYPSNPKIGGENSTGTLPNFKDRETPTEGITGE
jgi:hypothetical protein